MIVRRPTWWLRLRDPFQRPIVAYPAAAFVVVAVSALTLVARRHVPPQLNMSSFDGLLYARQAAALLEGDWLGPYNSTAMAKVPGYQLFIAASAWLGVPLKDAEQVVALLAAISVAICVQVVSRRLLWAVGAFVFCALDPLSFSSAAADLLRDSLFSSLTVLVVTSLFLTSYLLVFRRSLPWSLLGSLFAGLFLGAYLVTREEGFAVAPMAATALLAAPALRLAQDRAWRGPRLGRRVLRSTARGLPAVVVLGALAVAPLVVVANVNEERYGVDLTNDIAEGPFLEAYAQWQRVEAGPAGFRIPVNAAQRQAVYDLSATARRLEPTLEDPANGWRTFGCAAPPACDYAGGWLPWAMREAAGGVGAYDSGPAAQRFWSRLAQDIGQACDEGRLSCRTEVPPALHSIRRVSPGALVDAWVRHAGDLWSSRGMYAQLPVVVPVPDEYRQEIAAVSPSVPATAAAAADQQAGFNAHQWPYLLLGLAYTLLVPLAAGLGMVLIACVLLTRRGRQQAGPLCGLALALLFAVVTRLGLVAVVDAAEFAPPLRYIFPAHTLLLAFAPVAIAEGVRVLDLKRFGDLVRSRRAVADTDPALLRTHDTGTMPQRAIRRTRPPRGVDVPSR